MPYHIFTALSGEKALKLLNKEEIDFIITDIKIPNMHEIDRCPIYIVIFVHSCSTS